MSASTTPATGTLAGRPVHRVGYGAMQLEHRDRPGGSDRAAAVAVLRRARELGVDHVDTAQFYGAGSVNDAIREALHPYDGLVLVTKVGATHVGGALVPGQQPAQLRDQVHDNLRSLGVDRLDVVNLRRMDGPPGVVATGDQQVPLADQLGELTTLREQGLVGAIGLSNVTVEQLRGAEAAGVVCVQNSYSLLDRTSQPVLDECLARGLAFVPYFPLGSAFAQRAKVTDHPTVRAVAERLGATPAQVGLAALLALDRAVLLIPGTASPEHLADNVGAGRLTLDEATLAELAMIQ